MSAPRGFVAAVARLSPERHVEGARLLASLLARRAAPGDVVIALDAWLALYAPETKRPRAVVVLERLSDALTAGAVLRARAAAAELVTLCDRLMRHPNPRPKAKPKPPRDPREGHREIARFFGFDC